MATCECPASITYTKLILICKYTPATTKGTPAAPNQAVMSGGAPSPSPSASTSNNASSSPSSAEDKAKLAEEVKGKTSAVKNLVAGGVGGICAVIVGQPFDMVRVEMQNYRSAPCGNGKEYLLTCLFYHPLPSYGPCRTH